MAAIFIWLLWQIRYKYASNRRVYIASIKETISQKLNQMYICQLILTKISEIVYRDIGKV